MTVTEYIDYFEQIAENLLDISHNPTGPVRFAVVDIDEVLTGIKTVLKWVDKPALILVNFSGSLEHRPGAKIRDSKKAQFLIVQAAIRGEDYQEIKEILDSTRETGFKVLSKIYNDREEYELGNFCDSFIKEFYLSTVKYFKVGPKFDNCYGWLFELEIEDETELLFNPLDWK